MHNITFKFGYKNLNIPLAYFEQRITVFNLSYDTYVQQSKYKSLRNKKIKKSELLRKYV